MIRYTRFESPLGPVVAVAGDAGLMHVDFVGAKYERPIGRDWVEDASAPALRACREQLGEYFAGRRKDFDLPLAAAGSDFQKRVWQEITRVPYGQTITYGELAKRAGAPGQARAAGRATGRNPLGHRGAVPSHHGRGRQPHRIRRRPRAQARAAGAGRRAAGVARLRTQDLARLVALAAMWGASYLFMRYAVPHLGPVLMIELRVLIAGLALAAFVYASGRGTDWRQHWRGYLFVGAIGLALPFALIAEALTVIDASTAAILNALSPLWATIFSALWLRDPITPAKMAGITLCLAGTAVLVGWTPAPITHRELVAAAMSVARHRALRLHDRVHQGKAQGREPDGDLRRDAALRGARVGAVHAAGPRPARGPAMAWWALAGLAIVSTTVAFIFYYRLIAGRGAGEGDHGDAPRARSSGWSGACCSWASPSPRDALRAAPIILFGCSLILGLVNVPSRRIAS
jgi:O-6-methylguanine DNA methyltransferase